MRCVRLFLLLLLIPACDAARESERPFLTRTLTTADGETAHYVLFVPQRRDPNEKLPVILFLNGWGENGDDGLRQISNNFGGDLWRMRAEFPFLAVCPQCTYNAEWLPGSKNGDLALAVLEEAIREFNGDPERVSITGASTGGTGALNLAFASPGRFAAVAPIAAPIHIASTELVRQQIPVWSFHNRGDSSSLVRAARETRLQHLESGASPLVTEFDQSGHNAWDAAYASPALYRWLLDQRTGTWDAHLPFTPLRPERVLTEWSKTGAGLWKADDANLVCLSNSETTELHSPLWNGDWSFHFDIQIEPGQPAVVALLDAAGTRHELVLPLSDDDQARLVTANGPIHRADPAAQRAIRSGWNDLRLESRGNNLTVIANGWRLFDQHPLPGASPIRVALVKRPGPADQRFRFLRVSPPALGAPAT